MRKEYRRQDFSVLERGKFYAEVVTESAAQGDGSNQISKVLTMNFQELIAVALQLAPDERADMASVLLSSLPPPDPEIERLWGEEALRRLAAHRRGEGVSIPAEQIFGKFDSE